MAHCMSVSAAVVALSLAACDGSGAFSGDEGGDRGIGEVQSDGAVATDAVVTGEAGADRVPVRSDRRSPQRETTLRVHIGSLSVVVRTPGSLSLWAREQFRDDDCVRDSLAMRENVSPAGSSTAPLPDAETGFDEKHDRPCSLPRRL